MMMRCGAHITEVKKKRRQKKKKHNSMLVDCSRWVSRLAEIQRRQGRMKVGRAIHKGRYLGTAMDNDTHTECFKLSANQPGADLQKNKMAAHWSIFLTTAGTI